MSKATHLYSHLYCCLNPQLNVTPTIGKSLLKYFLGHWRGLHVLKMSELRNDRLAPSKTQLIKLACYQIPLNLGSLYSKHSANQCFQFCPSFRRQSRDLTETEPPTLPTTPARVAWPSGNSFAWFIQYCLVWKFEGIRPFQTSVILLLCRK